MYKNERKTKYITHQQTTTTELQAHNLGQTHTYRMAEKSVFGQLLQNVFWATTPKKFPIIRFKY